MNLKLVFGIVIPLIIIILLAGLSNLNIGFSVQKDTSTSLNLADLFTNTSQVLPNIPVQTITLNNDFFLPRQYELPRYIACLNDQQAKVQRYDMQIIYSEGKLIPGNNIPIFYDLVYDYYSSSRKSVELSSNSMKQVKVSAQPINIYYSYYYPYKDPRIKVVPPITEYENKVLQYESYDELLLLEISSTQYYYNRCQELSSEELDKAIHIPIIK